MLWEFLPNHDLVAILDIDTLLTWPSLQLTAIQVVPILTAAIKHQTSYIFDTCCTTIGEARNRNKLWSWTIAFMDGVSLEGTYITVVDLEDATLRIVATSLAYIQRIHSG